MRKNHVRPLALYLLIAVAAVSDWATQAASETTGQDRSPAAGPASPAAAGEAIARSRCSSCHALALVPAPDLAAIAEGGGPDLSFAGSKFRQEWLAAWLAAPRRIRPAGYLPFRYTVSTAQGDRVDASLLPDHPRLVPDEARAVAAYLGTLEREINPFPLASPGELRAEVHFDKILPCGGCHQARPGRGGVSGPELYSASRRLERHWATSFVADPLYWTRGPMPRVNVRSDQLAAVAEYLFAAESEEHDAALGAAALAGAAAAPAGGGQAAGARPNDRAATLYLMLCTQCHGITGDGRGINAPALFVAPRDHTSFADMSALTDERIFSAIKRGGPGVGKSALMPSWGAVLPDEDISALVVHLRRLSGTTGGEAAALVERPHATAR